MWVYTSDKSIIVSYKMSKHDFWHSLYSVLFWSIAQKIPGVQFFNWKFPFPSNSNSPSKAYFYLLLHYQQLCSYLPRSSFVAQSQFSTADFTKVSLHTLSKWSTLHPFCYLKSKCIHHIYTTTLFSVVHFTRKLSQICTCHWPIRLANVWMKKLNQPPFNGNQSEASNTN